ncbi:DMT family transporter [Aestuariibius sp. HNIBRBA575]|uniref:DMT family transporter n=1 Tax=Aestuariibius sp. HNIBRBA575 TaxID=3233343 RepID=UPI0034A482F8
MPLRYWGIIVILAAGWGASFFFNEILLRELGPLSVAMGRVGTGALGCWIWLLATGKKKAVPMAALGQLAVFGLFQYSLPLAIYPVTQQFITSSAAGIVNAMTPIMVVIVSHYWPGGERATKLKSIGVCFGFAGIILLALPSLRGQGQSNGWALLATICAPVCYGIAMNYMRRLHDLDRTLLTAWSLTLGSVVLIPLALLVEGLPVITQTETWASLMVIGFLLTSAAFILLFWLIPRVGATTASTITFIAPVSSVLLGVLVLAEELAPVQYAGMAVIFFGMLFIDGRLIGWFRNSQPNG